MSTFLSEAFKKLNLLEEETFDISTKDGIEDMSLFMDDDEADDSITVIDAEAESEASEVLKSVGVVYLAWPHSQNNPDGDTNRAVLNEDDIKILKIEQVEVDEKNRLIENSVKEIQYK